MNRNQIVINKGMRGEKNLFGNLIKHRWRGKTKLKRRPGICMTSSKPVIKEQTEQSILNIKTRRTKEESKCISIPQ